MLEFFGQNGSITGFARQYFARAFASAELTSWIWLAGTVLALDLFYRFLNRPRSESFWTYSAPWRIYTHPSAIIDYQFFVVQKLITVIIIAPMLVSALALGNWGAKIMVSWLGPGPGWAAGPAALVILAGARLLLFDIGHYLSHYLQHKVPFFWEFHRVHHAAEVLTPVTAFRAHPVESLLDSLFQGPLQALGLAVFYYLYGAEQSLITFVALNAIVPFYYLLDNLRHSHLWISFGPMLEHIFSSPAQHQIHHSRAPRHLDTNFSKYFSFLDWIGGTLYVPQEKEALDFGLSEGPDPELNDIWSLHWVPVKRAFRQLFPRSEI